VSTETFCIVELGVIFILEGDVEDRVDLLIRVLEIGTSCGSGFLFEGGVQRFPNFLCNGPKFTLFSFGSGPSGGTLQNGASKF